MPIPIETALTATLAPAVGRWELPATPQRVADLPRSTKVMRGPLGMYLAPPSRRRGLVVPARAFVFVRVRCSFCRRDHSHPWRWDWGVSAGVMSYQVSRCWDRPDTPYAVALDPRVDEANRAVHAEAHGFFEIWLADLDAARPSAVAIAPAALSFDAANLGPPEGGRRGA